MSPMPTALWEQHVQDLARRHRRGVRLEEQTPDRGSGRAGDGSGCGGSDADPRLLEHDWRTWFARAHIGWARRYAPWLLSEDQR